MIWQENYNKLRKIMKKFKGIRKRGKPNSYAKINRLNAIFL